MDIDKLHIQFNSVFQSDKRFFLRSAADDFSLDLKNVRFRAHLNCFSRDSIKVALICGTQIAA